MAKGKQSPATSLPADPKGAAYLTRKDGWNNFFTGVGISGTDRRQSAGYSAVGILPENTVRNLYRGDGMAKQVIEIPTETMMKSGFEIMADPEGMILARMEETGIYKALENMVRWSRLFGGSLGVIGVDDAQTYDKPLNLARIRKVHYVHVYNRWRVTYSSSDMYQDISHPKFGTPEFYRVQPLLGAPFKVHESRTIRMDGAPVDDLTQMQNQGWGDSYLQSCFDEIRQLSGVYTAVESIVDDFVTQTMGIKGLADLMKSGKEAVAIKRLEFLDKSRHVINTNLIDADLETFTKTASSLAGIPDALDRFMNKLASVSRIPVTLFQGMAPAGLNATGDADRSNWHDQVQSWQKKDLLGPIQYLTKLIFLSQDDYFEGKEPENWWVEFNKIWEPSQAEQATMEKTQVETIVSLITNNVMSEDEARELPEIKNRYNLEGPAPESNNPFVNPEDKTTGESDPEDLGDEPGAVPGPVKNTDSMPIDPAFGFAGVNEFCRARLMGPGGKRQRKDAADFRVKTLILDNTAFDSQDSAANWVRGHGFSDSDVIIAKTSFRFYQDSKSLAAGTEHAIPVSNGVTAIMAKVKRG